MKFAQVSVVLGALLLQVLIVRTEDEPAADVSSHIANDEPAAPPTTPAPENPTRPPKSGETETHPPLNRDAPPNDVKNSAEGSTTAPSSETTKTPGGSSNSLYHSMALVICVTSFLNFI